MVQHGLHTPLKATLQPMALLSPLVTPGLQPRHTGKRLEGGLLHHVDFIRTADKTVERT